MLWDVVQGLGMFTIGAGIVGYVAKYGIQQYFEKSLNKYQKELEKDKLRFSELHTKRAEITAELYERFVEFEEDMRSLTDPIERESDPSKDEKLQKAAESGNEFLNFYMKNKIYFPPEICDTIEDLHEEMKSVYNKFGIYKPYQSRPGNPQDPEEWLESWKRVTEDEVPELKEELENHFRELLGVELDQ